MHGKTFENACFLLALVMVTAAFLWVISGFLTPIFWAATLGVLFHPLRVRLTGLVGGRTTLAATLTLLIILVAVILPSILLSITVAAEATQLYGRVERGEIDPGAAVQWFESMVPRATQFADAIGVDLDSIRERVSSIAVSLGDVAGSFVVDAGQSVIGFAVAFGVMLYLLFFALRDGEQLLHMLMRVVPLGDERERLLFGKFAAVTRATIKGTVVIGAIQGTLGGAIFALLGIDSALFWGVVMGVLSLLPAVGAAIIWVPAAIILAVDGDWARALILTAFGVVAIGLVDNLLRPVLVGRDTRMPDYLILVATLGGLGAFGLSGFVIGPVVAALFLAFWTMFEREHRTDFQSGAGAGARAETDEVEERSPARG
ncbi:MAG TPA: AI-2E family transporter [Pseudomonadales bacterium]|nr:AI-2E family transporter [Pseudomonadales bacterium]